MNDCSIKDSGCLRSTVRACQWFEFMCQHTWSLRALCLAHLKKGKKSTSFIRYNPAELSFSPHSGHKKSKILPIFFSFLWNSSYFFSLSFPRLNGKLSKHGEKKTLPASFLPPMQMMQLAMLFNARYENIKQEL